MTRDEVMTMTDAELRIKAAELMGWREFLSTTCEPIVAIPPGEIVRDVYGFVCCGDVPDYPNDIAAAWELGAYAQKLLDNEEWRGRTLEMAEFFAWNAGIDRDEWDDDPYYALRGVLKHLTPCAITRAFILAMGSEAK